MTTLVWQGLWAGLSQERPSFAERRPFFRDLEVGEYLRALLPRSSSRKFAPASSATTPQYLALTQTRIRHHHVSATAWKHCRLRQRRSLDRVRRFLDAQKKQTPPKLFGEKASLVPPLYLMEDGPRIDVWSKNYNPSGTVQPSEYRFPFEDAQFDFVMVGSVFTHMFPNDVDHYIGEISRVLEPGGKGWVTFFLLNKESETAIADKTSTLDLAYEVEQGSRVDNPNRLESAIGHQEQLVRQMFAKYDIQADVTEYGSWCGRQAPSFQDVFKITKR